MADAGLAVSLGIDSGADEAEPDEVDPASVEPERSVPTAGLDGPPLALSLPLEQPVTDAPVTVSRTTATVDAARERIFVLPMAPMMADGSDACGLRSATDLA